MSDRPHHISGDDEFEAAEAERASVELKGQIARARRVVDQARRVLGGESASQDGETA